ncbi:MAG: aminoglycoside phosphotransferase family protein, partial [Ktedonobacterales bacterium]
MTAESTLETELKQVIRERVEVAFGAITELSGGFTGDQIFRVPFSYWYPVPGEPGAGPFTGAGQRTNSVIIKRSTSDAFHTATENYRQLPPLLRRFFVRQPAESQVHKSGLSSAYFLTMEDLASLQTLSWLVNEWDQRAMSEIHARLLRTATDLVSGAVFTLFRETLAGKSAIPGTQIARLYLSPIEGKLARAVQRVPWLKNPLQGYIVSEQRYKGLDHYLAILARHGPALQPRMLGLTHGDLHAGNVMLDRYCTQIKLIDLDKLSWTGDYLADLGNLLTDVCIYRRVAEPHREFGLAREDITFPTRSQEPGTAENVVQYPALARPATLAFQRHLLAAAEQFAAEIEDRAW